MGAIVSILPTSLGEIKPLTSYISLGTFIFLLVLSILLIVGFTIANILIWTIPPKSRKKALKNLNGDKKLYRKIWTKSGYFIAFAIVSSVSLFNIYTTFFSGFLYPFFSLGINFNSFMPDGTDWENFFFLSGILPAYVQYIVGYIIAISFKSKADKAALNKSSHTGIVKKIKENRYKKK